MRTNWLIGALVTFIIGFLLTLTIIGSILGVPLIVLSLFFLLFGIILPAKSVKHAHHYKKKKTK